MKEKVLYSVRVSEADTTIGRLQRYGGISLFFIFLFYLSVHLVIRFEIDLALILFVGWFMFLFFYYFLVGKCCSITPYEVKERRGIFEWKSFPINDIKEISIIFFLFNKNIKYDLTIKDNVDPFNFDMYAVDKRYVRLGKHGERCYLGGIATVYSPDLREMLRVLKSLFSLESWQEICNFKKTIENMDESPVLWDIVKNYQQGNELKNEEKKLVETLKIYFGDIETLFKEKEKLEKSDKKSGCL